MAIHRTESHHTDPQRRRHALRFTAGTIVAAAVLYSLVGCTPSPNASTPTATPTPGSSSTPTATTPSTEPPDDQTAAPLDGDKVIAVRLTQNWAAIGAGAPVTITHDNAIPIAPPPAAPLPSLYTIGAGRHPAMSPPYNQLSFRFQGGFPSYDLQTLSELVGDPSGLPIAMTGTAGILRVTFYSAQAHTEAGPTSIVSAPPLALGFPAITRYSPAGDFEGYVTYGIGIGRPDTATSTTPIRVYEVEKIEQGQHLYVVAIQVDATDWRLAAKTDNSAPKAGGILSQIVL
ncbi:hypothetical protein [Cryobacterium sp. CG_9.6]|uniref:AMIN-like domain-containing (lipo)protein n=1 Tax=Cryobacterium sp. CG_9.6 TaxID=2760710 RepID=UPI0024749646|nr:hypothetical protein [Cryobacterium sp. CG_9.6]MDH6237553.1 hypothetical protein [Cryobacterium sp. CG_9.6]